MFMTTCLVFICCISIKATSLCHHHEISLHLKNITNHKYLFPSINRLVLSFFQQSNIASSTYNTSHYLFPFLNSMNLTTLSFFPFIKQAFNIQWVPEYTRIRYYYLINKFSQRDVEQSRKQQMYIGNDFIHSLDYNFTSYMFK